MVKGKGRKKRWLKRKQKTKKSKFPFTETNSNSCLRSNLFLILKYFIHNVTQSILKYKKKRVFQASRVITSN